MYQTPIPETLNPKRESEASPSSDEESRRLPEEDGDAAACDPSDTGREDEHAPEGLGRRINSGEDTKLEDEDETDEGEGVETDEEE